MHANKRVDFKGLRVTVVEMYNMFFNCRHNILLTKEGRPYGPMDAVKPLMWLHLKEHFIIFWHLLSAAIFIRASLGDKSEMLIKKEKFITIDSKVASPERKIYMCSISFMTKMFNSWKVICLALEWYRFKVFNENIQWGELIAC